MQPNIFGTFVDQVKLLLALSYERFEAIRHKTHYKCPFKKPLMIGRKDFAPEIFKPDTLRTTDKEVTVCLANSSNAG
jgi:hypothetical protein